MAIEDFDQVTIAAAHIRPFSKFIMSIGEMPTSYLDSLSYAEQITWFCNFLQDKVIPAINNNAEALEEVQGLMTQLQEYVDNYFTNLDVQDEIDNKLDEMVEQGTLQEIIADYLNSKAIFGFDNVASMKSSSNLIDGSYAKTLGYYEINDGGSATYKIRSITNEDIIDNMTLIAMENENLVAELIINDIINIKQLGARSQYQNTKYDIKEYIDKYLDIQTKNNKRYKLYIPAGIWYTSGNYLYHKLGFSIIGDASFPGFDNRANGTIISTYNNNQDYIFRLGSSANVCSNWNLENLIFSSADINYNNNNYYFSTLKNVSKAVELHYAEYGISDNLFFMHIKGNCLTINSCWENYFKLLNFRTVSNENGSIINFETIDTTLGNANVTANAFEKIMFEKFHGNLINIEKNANVYNNHFGIINIEDNKLETENRVYTNFTDEILNTWDDNNCVHYAVFNFEAEAQMGENVIDSIEMNNYSSKYYTYDNNYYVYDCIIKYGNKCICNNIYNNINLNGMKKNCKIIYTPSNVTVLSSARQFNTFNNFGTDSQKNFIFDVRGLDNVNVNENAYLFGISSGLYSNNIQTFDYLKLGGWIPCYKSKTMRFFSNSLGLLYYDEETLNPLRLNVTPIPTVFDRSFLNTIVNVNKTIYIRAKVPNGAIAKFNITNKTKNENIEKTINGTGSYQIYELSLTDTWDIGDILHFTVGGSSAEQRVMSFDSYISC